MKKIVSAVAIAAMAAGFATAEMKATLNYRTQMNAFSYDKVENGKKTTTTTTKFDQSGYADAKDAIKFAFNGENAGATLQLDPTAGTGSPTINNYNAWLKFGALKFEGGTWKDGYADGAYRVKKFGDATSLQGVDGEAFKLGSLYKSRQSSFVDDLSSGGKLSLFAEYTLPATDDLTLKLLGGIVTSAWYSDSVVDGDETDATNDKSGYVARVQANLNGTLDSEFIWKSMTNRNGAFALYVRPKMVSGLDMTVGGAVEYETYTMSGWNVDLRARYAVDSNLAISTWNNISAVSKDADKNGSAVLSKELTGIKGGSDWGAKYDTATAGSGTTMAMWNNINAQYKINDMFTPFLSVGLLTPLSKASKDDKATMDVDVSMQWRVTPGVQIFAASNAFFTIGASFSGTSYKTAAAKDNEVSHFTVSVPVIFRVKM
ncbi:MAG: hypothetical protein KBT11_03655 [Treponema sp.]|nr:hypothetical protein [Candidatus Treponema equifaecale]